MLAPNCAVRLYGMAARRRIAQQWAEHSVSAAWHSMPAGSVPVQQRAGPAL